MKLLIEFGLLFIFTMNLTKHFEYPKIIQLNVNSQEANVNRTFSHVFMDNIDQLIFNEGHQSEKKCI